MDKSKYSIDVLPLFKNTQDNILSKDIKVLEPLIDYTKENRDEKKDMDYYYTILANPLKFNKLLKDKYDCVIACNHNAPSGRLDNNKNQILLLKAAKIAKRYRTDFRIYLLGDGEDRKKLESYIEENNLEENVQILGFKENPYPYIKNSVATVLTSFSEGFSLALAESAILDTPIISTDVGIAKELIKKYDCGTLIGYDEKELAEVLLKYMDQNDEDREKKHFNIGNEFNIEAELEKTIQVIEDTIDKAEGKTKMKKLPYPVEQIYYLENSSLILKTIIQKMNIER